MQTKDIISVLDNAKQLCTEQQPVLRQYVLNKLVSLEERFRVWIAHCEKYHYPTADTDFIDKMFVAGFVIPLSPPIVLTYDNLLDHYSDNKVLQELIMQENFGSLLRLWN